MSFCYSYGYVLFDVFFFFFQAEDGIRDLVRSRGLGDVYKRQIISRVIELRASDIHLEPFDDGLHVRYRVDGVLHSCLLYTSDAADERSSVDLGGRRIIKKKKTIQHSTHMMGHEKKMQMNVVQMITARVR